MKIPNFAHVSLGLLSYQNHVLENAQRVSHRSRILFLELVEQRTRDLRTIHYDNETLFVKWVPVGSSSTSRKLEKWVKFVVSFYVI